LGRKKTGEGGEERSEGKKPWISDCGSGRFVFKTSGFREIIGSWRLRAFLLEDATSGRIMGGLGKLAHYVRKGKIAE